MLNCSNSPKSPVAPGRFKKKKSVTEKKERECLIAVSILSEASHKTGQRKVLP